MNRAWTIVMAVVLACSPVALGARTTTRPFAAVTYEHEVRENPPMHLHVVTVDLTDPRVKLRVVKGGELPKAQPPWQTVLAPASVMAEREGFDVAVNGNFFASKATFKVAGREVPYFFGNWGRAIGAAMTDGKLWSASQAGWPSLVVDAQGKAQILWFREPPATARQIVSGSQIIVTAGKASGDGPDQAPRTAVGVNKEGTLLVLLVVDGRRPEYSAGMTLPELGREMVRLGCWQAMNLDGGGSSTLVMRDRETGKCRAINRPSDGHDLAVPISVERSVACSLGIMVEAGAATRPGQIENRKSPPKAAGMLQ